jgi:uncharacterized lipoprotein YmbA
MKPNQMRPTQIPILLAVVALLGGCASSPPEPTLYLLRGTPSEGAGPMNAELRVGLGRIVVAPYLVASQGVVVETAPGEVRPARQHRWAEPLDAGLRWYLRSEIGRVLGHEIGGGLVDITTWDYTIDVTVSRLHGTMTGEALIEAAYAIRTGAGRDPVVENRFTKSMPLPDEGYAAVVEAERRLVAELADSIGESLRGVLASSQAEAPEAPTEP